MTGFILKTKKFFLFLGDIGCLYLALYLTLVLRYWGNTTSENWPTHAGAFLFIFMAWLLVFYISDFYELKISYNNFSLLTNYGRAIIINGIIAVLLFYFLAPLFPSIKPQRVLIIDLVVTFILLFGWRKIFYGLIKSPQIANHVLIIGNNPLSAELLEEIKKRPQLGYVAQVSSQIPEDLKKYCIDNNIDILTADNTLHADASTAKKIFDCLSLGIDVHRLTDFYETIAQKVPVESIELGWFLENLTENSKKSYEIFKRLIDVILAIAGLIVATPLMPFIALIIKIESPGPVIFRQIRVGKNGKEFLAMKFRSMVKDAEKNGAQWATKNDARVTRFGRIMRKTRLDEIPQLLNILRGEMSLIGPRPERPEFTATLAQEIPFYSERLLVKPGLAGWAQLLGPAYGGSQKETVEKLKYDLYYIKNRSLLLDLSITLKTIGVVFGGRGQ
ncbi:MAG: sugar transferase [Patescibacteria group bacterium]|jgi:exopolysaccharide biosynthesis polyprenyl glycosylphosphotransferase